MKRSLLTLLGVFFCLSHASSTWAAPSNVSPTCNDFSNEQQKALYDFRWTNQDSAFKPDFCDPDNLAYHVAKALLFTKSVGKLNGSALDKSGQGFLSNDPYQFFSRRIRSIQFEPDGEDCSDVMNAYVDAAEDIGKSDGVMHVCQSLAKLDDYFISSVLIHEARHEEGYHHVPCHHGFYMAPGQRSCDESYSSGGSYAIQAEYLIKTSRSSRVDPSIRQNSRANAIELLAERFNQLPLGLQKGAVLLTQGSEDSYSDVLFYDGKTTTPLGPQLASTDRLYPVNGYLKVYNVSTKTQVTYADGIHPGPIKTNLDYRGSEAGQFIDTYASSMTTCNLFTHGVDCSFSGKRVILPIKDFTPIGFWSYVPLNSSDNAVRIASKEGRVYIFTEGSNTFQSAPASTLNSGDWNENYFILLGSNGKLSFFNKKNRETVSSIPGIDPDLTFTKMITPYFWSKQLQEL